MIGLFAGVALGLMIGSLLAMGRDGMDEPRGNRDERGEKEDEG